MHMGWIVKELHPSIILLSSVDISPKQKNVCLLSVDTNWYCQVHYQNYLLPISCVYYVLGIYTSEFTCLKALCNLWLLPLLQFKGYDSTTRNWGKKSLNSIFNLPTTGEGNSESEESYYDNWITCFFLYMFLFSKRWNRFLVFFILFENTF